MSLKSCVICIAGDLKQDIFAPATWEDADIERYFKQRGMTLVWGEMNKAVTHLVVSRAAFRSNHAAVKYVQKDRREKKKAKIVTYDWLEDSLDAAKAIQDVSAYHPSKPRDIDAIVALCRKPPKAAKCKPMDESALPEQKGRSEALVIRTQDQTRTESSTSSILESGSKVKLAAAAVEKPSSSVVTESTTLKKQVVSHKPSYTPKQPIPAPYNQTHIKKNAGLEKSQVKKTPVTVSYTSLGLSWEARHKPRVFCDKTDQFKYCIKLIHKEKPGEKWVLMLLKAPDVVDEAFLFRAYQYNAKDKIDLRETNSPPSTFQKASELFKTSFRSKMGYAWDERLLRADHSQQGKWRYKLPAKGEPTGQVSPEFDPGHPNFDKSKDLAPNTRPNAGQKAIKTNVPKPPGPPGTCGKAQKGKMKGVYLSKVRKSAAPISSKRRAEDSLGEARRTKVNKTGSSKFKSSGFVEDSDTDDTSPKPPYQMAALGRQFGLLK